MNKNNRMVDVLVQCICCGDILGRIGMLANSGYNETGKLSKIETLCDECSRKEKKMSYRLGM